MRQAFKNIFTLPLAAVTALLLAAGCDKQAADAPVTGFPEDGVVRVSTGGAATRADGESLYLGTNLGLFIDYGNGDRHTMSNVRWTKGTSDWAPDTQMLWKDATTPAALYAYAPYVEGQTDPSDVQFYIPSDQTSGTTAADLVFWNNTSFAPNDKNEEFVDGKVLISFSHALTKLTLNFEKASQFASDVMVEEVVLKNTPQFVYCNVKEDGIRRVSVVDIDIKMHKMDDLQYDAIFYPGYGQSAGMRMLEVTMSDGTILYYDVPASGLVSGDLQDGKAYSMNMMLGKDKIEVIDDITVTDWTDGDPFDSSEAEIDETYWDGRTVATSFESGTGTETDPFIIAKASQLAYLAQSVNSGESYSGKYFRQTSNLSLSNKPWTPIGLRSTPFSGNFDGNGNKISELYIGSETAVKYSGLFGYAKNGSVKNVTVASASIVVPGKSWYVAILCGESDGVTIDRCSVHGSVDCGDEGSVVGGLVGELGGTTMTGCTAEVTVKGNANIGGLCGRVGHSTISDCSVESCLVESSDDFYAFVGGLIGSIQGGSNTITKCSVNGIVKSVKGCGGLVGAVSSKVNMSDCTACVDLSFSGVYCGGLFARLTNYDDQEFSNCGFNGTITGNGNYKGAAVGKDRTKAKFTDCWYNADKTGDLPAVGKSEDNAVGKDYSGIEAKHLGK